MKNIHPCSTAKHTYLKPSSNICTILLSIAGIAYPEENIYIDGLIIILYSDL